MVDAHAPDAPFPVDAYVKYKRVTTFFLDWLLRTAGKEILARQHVDLSTLKEIADDFITTAATSESTEPQVNLRGLNKALDACQCAIILRERVAQFFKASAADEDAQESHEHFLELLREWHTALTQLKRMLQAESQPATDSDASESISSNYFGTLDLGDDDEDEGGDGQVSSSSSGVAEQHSDDSSQHRKPKRSKRWTKFFDQQFTENLQFELGCFVVSIDELVERVFRAFREVKLQHKTLVEAASVVAMAMERADSLIAKLQLRYPSISLASHLVAALTNYLSKDFSTQTQYSSERNEKLRAGPYDFELGVIHLDLREISTLLTRFAEFIPKDEGNSILIRRTGNVLYCEETTRDFVSLLSVDFDIFLMQLLIQLYNAVQKPGSSIRSAGLSGNFLSKVVGFFKTKEVAVSLVFAILCWIQSIAALQGDLGLSRSVSVLIQHVWRLSDNVQAALDTLQLSDTIRPLFEDLSAQLGFFIEHLGLLRTNPILAGFVDLDFGFQYLQLGNAALSSAKELSVVKEMYDKLVQYDGLQYIDFFYKIFAILDLNPTGSSTGENDFNPPVSDGVCIRELPRILRLAVENGKITLAHEQLEAGAFNVCQATVSGGSLMDIAQSLTVALDTLVLLRVLNRFFSGVYEAYSL